MAKDSAAEIKENLAGIEAGIAESCTRVGRNASEVKVLAATKSQSVEKIQAAIDAGIKICGENYLQEAEKKINEIGPVVQWHFIGHLQSNKAKKAVELFDCIQSVDTAKLARKIDNACQKPFSVFIGVNIGREENKFGVLPENLQAFYSEIKELPNLDIKGLFCMAPFLPPEKTRPYFKEMRQLAEKLSLKELSMGTSNDYSAAVEEGSTMVRNGTALFGKREK